MWLIQSRQRDGGLAQRPTLSQYEHERVNSELSVGKFSLILRSCGSCLGNWIVTTAPCVVTASVTGSHYNCRALNPFGGNQTSASCRQIIWYSSSIGHYYSYPDDIWWHWTFPWIEILKRCIRQLLVTVVTCPCMASRGPGSPWSPAHHVSPSCHQLDRDNKLIQIGSQSSMLRSFCAFFARRAAWHGAVM